ncbi:MAG: rhodanese-like domain protein [Herbaspirillum sp.]|jgi:thiosulfate/3-mercaptopyruvate sulfurtransferase|nr:rhodanese-like domain protein [Herbaspirillum sp.]
MSYTTLISAQQLAELLQRSPSRTVVIDCRHDLMQADAGPEAYKAAHLPGAMFADLNRDLTSHVPAADGRFKGRHPLPEKAPWLATLRGWGVNDDTQVVAYDAHGGMFAARLWWMLRWVGHSAAAVLDGGVPAWQQEGYALTAAVEKTPAPGHIGDRPSLVKTVGAEELLLDIVTHPLPGARQNLIVDARAPDRFRGENETLDPVGGHIPGAKNRFFKENLQADGRFKPAATLRAEWEQLIHAPQQNVMQCGSGVTACHNLLALEIAGLSGAALYPGSWSEWCADAARPVATGV